MTYQVADGSDNEGSYVDLNPQPSCEGIRYPLRVISANNTPKDKGARFAILVYEGEITADQYTNVLSQLGLTSAIYNDITLSLPDEDRTTFSNYNGRVFKPLNPVYKKGFYRDIEFFVRKLEDT